MRPAVEVVERDGHDVVVLRRIGFAARRAPVRVAELPLGLDFEDLALVLVGLSVPLALEGDRASDLPVGLHLGAEVVLLDPLRVGERSPHLARLGINIDGCFSGDLVHLSLVHLASDRRRSYSWTAVPSWKNSLTALGTAGPSTLLFRCLLPYRMAEPEDIAGSVLVLGLGGGSRRRPDRSHGFTREVAELTTDSGCRDPVTRYGWLATRAEHVLARVDQPLRVRDRVLVHHLLGQQHHVRAP